MELTSNIPNFSGEIDVGTFLQALAQANEAIVQDTYNFLIEKFKEPKHGKKYSLPGGGTYTASAPGEYPAIKTGDLAASLTRGLGKTKVSKEGVSTTLSADVDHAWELEGKEVFVFKTAPNSAAGKGRKKTNVHVVDSDNSLGVRPWMSRVIAEEVPEFAKTILGDLTSNLLNDLRVT